MRLIHVRGAKGVNAIVIREDDQLIQVRLTDGNSQVIMANREGRAIRFPENKVREMGRISTGVRGMTLGSENDEVVGMITMTGAPDETVMVISQNGYGKRSALDDYRITNRGGKGVKTMAVTEKTGELVAIKNVNDHNDLMIINQSGITLRLSVADIRVMGRATQGVKLIDLSKRGDTIASVCKVDSDPEEAAEENEMEPSEKQVAENGVNHIEEMESDTTEFMDDEQPDMEVDETEYIDDEEIVDDDEESGSGADDESDENI